jgi:uncharacterized protein YndB with AHSA1/START domain
MIRTIAWIAAAVLALGIVITTIGWLLPVAHEVSRTGVVAAPPERVYDIVSRVEAYPTWWHDITRVEMLPAEAGHVRFRQHDSTGSVVMEVVERVPPRRFMTRIADPEQPFGGTWTWELAREGAGTRVTITERGDVYNPLFRFMARFVFGYTSTLESHLTALVQAAR